MQGRHRQQPDDEPAVTFELDGAPQRSRRSRLGAAGTTAITGAGLISGGATPDVSDSLDVFEQGVDVEGEIDASDAIPTTSFNEIVDAAPDPEFPTIDFSIDAPAPELPEQLDVLHGAAGAVGGGFRLDDPASQAALGAPLSDAAGIDDQLLDDGFGGHLDAPPDDDEPDDLS